MSYKIPWTKEELEITPLCLNVGSGGDYRGAQHGDKLWVNIDGNPEISRDADIPLDKLHEVFEGQALFIVARDILEHIPFTWKTRDAWRPYLTSWVRCLKPGGKIEIQVPDMYMIFKGFVEGEFDEDNFNRYVFGEDEKWDRHYQLFSLGRLKTIMKQEGLHIVRAERKGICCIVEGLKRS